ncbi:putative sodium/calcium antiporter [Aurantimonas manganoxydans SI85-9A1]|uniref:Putative sodium/calcium antiporter n=1 Tax=Aurantimonas manganoxydans (strain ATCC BAA-1229 / DSM 21871 / SI85-9A1) TaxID=287752 RepID=Q1YK75_AURMS|nr:cation transporter [Aurantimonas manganoxydans]EAS50648.1 putative sodium/calcium antiporter [Aurantimonas manganoxydans SI85-9A1]
MLGLQDASIWLVGGAFLVAAVAIGFAGFRLSYVADTLADRTGMGEVVAGALFVGAATSLPGAITSISTAMQDAPGLAVGNALGGLTAQTAFIAIADLFYRRANLEHAAASVTGLAQGVLLVVLLTIPLIASAEPPVTIWGVHPASVVILISYAFGLKLLSDIKDDPMWKPVQTSETRESLSDPEEGDDRESGRSLWGRFALYAGITAVAGYVIGEASLALVDLTGLSQSAVGTIFSAVANSLPELVTAIAAVRIGAVSLAVGDVIGGNAFEVMFLSAADFFYDGSIYAAMEPQDRTTAIIAMLMTGVLLLGMLRRERTGPAGIGFESVLVLLLYAGSVVLIFL